VFKIQANMNPKHRDSVAFVRICSGRFERGMQVTHAQSGRTCRLQRPYKLFANEREIIDEARPGDVLGLPNAGDFFIGDTLCEGAPFQFAPIPRFHPEHFALLRNLDPGKQKQFIKGLRQLEMEGAVQVLYPADAFKREPVLAVLGALQFDVVQARLKNEYSVPTVLERQALGTARWVTGSKDAILKMADRAEILLCLDSNQDYVALFTDPLYLKFAGEKYPELKFETMA